MEESFELLSSMSPKVKGRQKHFRKGTTLLALKRHIRRSSVYDKSIHTVNNEELIIIEGSSTTDSHKSGNSKQKLLNETPIVISDTDFSSTDTDSNLASSKKSKERKQVRFKKRSKNSITRKHSPADNCLMPQDKFNDIKLWINNVENEIKQNTTTYSDLSTIYGDEIGGNFNPEGNGCAVNSTFVASDCMRFDEMFKNVEQNNLKTDHVPPKLIINNDKFNDINQSLDDLIIEESFIDLNESLNTRLKTKNNTNKGTPHKEVKSIISVQNNLMSSIKKQTHERVSDDSEIKCDNDLISMLDDLYGDKWREKEEHVLPKTEPRKRLPKHDIHVTNTDQKPKFSVLYKNPYVETEKTKSNNLLQNLHRTRIKMYLESPLNKRLNDLCDSETNSECSDKKLNPRMKLNFDNDSDSDYGDCPNLNNMKKTSKYFEKISVDLNEATPEGASNKENLDEFSSSGESLEERIRKKINKIKTVSEGNKNKTKKSTKTPKENKVTPLKEKIDNENYSIKKNNIPKKTTIISSNSKETMQGKTDEKLHSSSSSISSDDVWEKEISKITHETKVINGKYSFLASLSANVPIFQCDMLARIFRNNFKTSKDQLLKKLFKLFNESVFDNAIPEDTALEWNDRMRGTAGYCYCKKITRRTGAVERTARIVLSTKVIDAAYRLRDTLIHEMCHAATWIVNCVSDGHGSYWKAWACKAMKTFPELPPIKRCHDYAINTKYTYRCTGCGYSIGRHSKSLDIERKRCGYCMGKFEVLLNKTSKKGEIKSVPATPKKEATGFALFVKENYGVYKNPQIKHGDVMKILGQKFQEMKVNQD